jgi:large subunit ribosomal protein L4e
MKANILDLQGKKKGDMALPSFFSEKIREDIIAKVLEAKKNKQPYAPSPRAGLGYSARGKVRHLRHVWKSGYGRGVSRVPRKIMSRRGSQFNWVAASTPNAKGGIRAHPPKVISMINTKKINKKELHIAFLSALSATSNAKKLSEKYSNLENKKIDSLPFIVDSKLASLKAKKLIESVKKILGKDLFEIAKRKRSVRAGKGKLRGRKYKTSAGLLIVIGKDEKLKTNAFEIVNVQKLGVLDLAKGGSGRLTLYTENAIKDLGVRLK